MNYCCSQQNCHAVTCSLRPPFIAAATAPRAAHHRLTLQRATLQAAAAYDICRPQGRHDARCKPEAKRRSWRVHLQVARCPSESSMLDPACRQAVLCVTCRVVLGVLQLSDLDQWTGFQQSVGPRPWRPTLLSVHVAPGSWDLCMMQCLINALHGGVLSRLPMLSHYAFMLH